MLKKIISLILLFIVTACSQYSANGSWENIINENDTKVTTTLNISENFEEFTAVMTEKTEGAGQASAETPDEIKFSGYISGNTLVITQIEEPAGLFSRRTTLTISEDGKSLVLAPGGLTFVKK